ncbi:MAG: type III-A CRISPR-associated RAMP protein Csm4 [Oscillospiraceae bacterium]|jgi:CRISPR-associated protein Csm4|nr:type III-A CRISPR-associated RAMP protein Csm4 [Oscillospiraceae bacterium]
MRTILLRLHFSDPVHLGEGTLSDAARTAGADTLFSGLCVQALRTNGSAAIDHMVSAVRGGTLRLSDALPYIGETYYIPKPLLRIQTQESDSLRKKIFKKLSYIPLDKLPAYCAGTLEPEAEAENFRELVGKGDVRTQVHVSGDPFYVGTFRFAPNAGLYVVLQYEDSSVLKLFRALGYSGLGGKRSSGFGKFEVEEASAEHFADLNPQGRCMNLSLGMAQDAELPHVLQGASYLLKRRTGFVYSEDYSETPRRKRDFYAFVAGSVFRAPFAGDVFDVANGGAHPVWRYAAPIFLGLGVAEG